MAWSLVLRDVAGADQLDASFLHPESGISLDHCARMVTSRMKTKNTSGFLSWRAGRMA
jgi:hypothetical protein